MLMIEIYSPSVDTSYDFQVNENLLTESAVSAFSGMIAKKNKCDNCGISSKLSLYDIKGQRELDKTRTLAENGVQNGMRLILA